MPKKSKKSKSKRQTLKNKYKIVKKVAEHHRKKRKEAKKAGAGARKGPKDPGIPNTWPFKEELLAQMAAQRERAAAREKALREADAAARGAAYDAAAGDAPAPGAGAPGAPVEPYVDPSRRAFYRDFVRVVHASDVIIEVLDARDPGGTRCPDVEAFVRRVDPSKRVVLLLNKIDLVPREAAEAWLRHLREEAPAVAFKCSTQKQAAHLARRALPARGGAPAGGAGSECLGADTLLALLKNYSRGHSGGQRKGAVTVGVVGLPNVGKSSLINSLKRARVAAVGNAPGVTRSVQEVRLDKQLTLLDSPGVVFADAGADGAAAAALRNAVRPDALADPALPVAEIVRRCPARQLMALFKVPAFDGADEFLGHVAAARGKLRRGGAVDAAAAARIVLQEWCDGRIPYFTLPPARAAAVPGADALVADWAPAFDADAAYAAEAAGVIAALPSLDAGGDFFETAAGAALPVDLGGGERMDVGGGGGDGGSGSDSGEEMEEDAAPPAAAAPRGARSAAARQNEALYAAEGQFNPRAAKAERKRRKRGGPAGGSDGGGGAAPMAADAGGGDDAAFDWDAANAADANAFAGLADAGASSGDD